MQSAGLVQPGECRGVVSGVLNLFNHFLKYADDATTVVGLIQDDNELAYRDEVKHLVDWCKVNNLETWIRKHETPFSISKTFD